MIQRQRFMMCQSQRVYARFILKPGFKGGGGGKGLAMHGTFNGLRLNRITSLKTMKGDGVEHTSFRVLGEQVRALEDRLRLNTPALLILSDKIIEGVLV